MKNTKPLSILDKKTNLSSWEYYLARPFSLLGSSIWNHWYNSIQIKEILGHNMKDALFIETPDNSVINYRLKKQLHKFNQSIEELAKDTDKVKLIFTTGEKLNKKAAQKLKDKKFLSLDKEIEFLTSVAIYAGVIPYWVPNYLDDEAHADLLTIAKNLREKSFYPKLINQIIIPLAKNKIKSDVELLTLSELLSNDTNVIGERLEKRNNNLFFIYQNLDGNELVEWTSDPKKIIKKFGHHKEKELTIKGLVAFKGHQTGRARLILTNDYKNKKFNNGDILIAASTNPELMPLIRKASAIVTDEGGIMCHAAIISRELKKPCIIGTKKATSTINDGDLIEVDAEKGIIKIIEKSKK